MEVQNLKDFLSWHPPVVQEIISNGILLPESKLVLHGKYKSWKSMLAMDMALCIAKGRPWFNHATSKVPVFSLQIEVAKAAYQNRLLKYTKHNDCLSSNLFVATEHYIKIDSSFGMNDLDKAIKLCSPKVVIIDPLYKVISGDLNDSRDVVKFEDNIDILIDKYHCAFIIVHHEHKMRFDSDGNRVRQGAEAMTGSQMIANWADSVIGVEVTTSDYENPVELTITFTALRNAEYFPKPINILINRDDLTFRINNKPPKITPELQKLIDGALNPVNNKPDKETQNGAGSI